MHIVHIISSLERGGAQAVLYDVVQGFAQEGYEQSIIYFHEGPYVDRFAAAGMPLYRVQGIASSFDPYALYQLYNLLKKLNPTVIHTVLWAANLMGRIVARQLSIPAIASLHNNYDQNGTLRNIFDRMVPFSNDAIIAVSEEVKKSFYQYQSASCPLMVIHNGIQYQSFQQQTSMSRTSLNLTADHFVIGSVGRFAPVKRYPLLLAAFAQLYKEFPQVRLLLIGGGPQEQELRALAVQLGINEAVRWVINEPAVAYYALMDCFVLTSLKEGISIALLEAMGFGVACAVTYASLQHPVLEHLRNGIVVLDNNATLFSQNLAFLVTNNTVRKNLAKEAQQTVKNHFNSECMIAAYDRVFQRYKLEK